MRGFLLFVLKPVFVISGDHDDDDGHHHHHDRRRIEEVHARSAGAASGTGEGGRESFSITITANWVLPRAALPPPGRTGPWPLLPLPSPSTPSLPAGRRFFWATLGLMIAHYVVDRVSMCVWFHLERHRRKITKTPLGFVSAAVDLLPLMPLGAIERENYPYLHDLQIFCLIRSCPVRSGL